MSEQAVSRVLFPWSFIYGLILLSDSCGLYPFRLPDGLRLIRDSKGHFSRRNLFDLAQGGVFQAWDVTIPSGKLLPYLFTLIPTNAGTVSLSVALSLGLLPVAANDRLALLSSDFPPERDCALKLRRSVTGEKFFSYPSDNSRLAPDADRSGNHASCSDYNLILLLYNKD